MATLELPSEPYTRTSEILLNQFSSHSYQSLQIPDEISLDADVGIEVQLTQLIATWAKRNTSGPARLLVPARLRTIEAIRESEFFRTLPGLAAVYFSDEFYAGKERVAREIFVKAITPHVRPMQIGGLSAPQPEGRILFPCFGGAQSEFISSLYEFPKQRGVRDTADFVALLRRAVRVLAKDPNVFLAEEQLEYLASLLRELFLNADEHGSDDVEGNRPKRSLRGILLKSIAVDADKAPSRDYFFNAYLARLQIASSSSQSADNRIHLIEASVFDTGPGLGLRWLSKKEGLKRYADFSIQDEVIAVQTCFEKHATTKIGSYSGVGLSKVLDSMGELQSLTAIRTGRVSLIQDMTNRRRATQFKPNPRFTDREPVEEIAGAAFSVVMRSK